MEKNIPLQLSLFRSNLNEQAVEIPDFLLKAPKVDLHRHLLGSVSLDSFVKVSKKYGLTLPANVEDDLYKILKIIEPVPGLKEFFRPWRFFSRLLVKPEAVYDITYDVLSDLRNDYICYSEIRTSWGITGQEKFPVSDFLYALNEARIDAEKNLGVQARFLLGITRHIMGNQQEWIRNGLYQRLLEAAIPYKGKCVVGFDLSGIEKGYAPNCFSNFFKSARDAGFNISIHCGETTGPNSIWQSLKDLYADRIAHSLSAIEDPDLMEYLKRHRTGVEICPTSNLLTESVSSIKDHPVKEMYDSGVKVTINTDNPEICSTTLSKEYAILLNEGIFSKSEIFDLMINAINVSFAPIKLKSKIAKLFRALRKQQIEIDPK